MQRVKEDFWYTALFGLLLGIGAGLLAAIVFRAQHASWWLTGAVIVQLAAQLYVFVWTFRRIAGERWANVSSDRNIFSGDYRRELPERTPMLITNDQGSEGLYLDPPIDMMRLAVIAYQIYQGASFSHALSGAGKCISRAEYEALRDYLLSRGALAWRSPYDHRSGLELTRPGNAMVRHFASMIDQQPRLEG